MVNLIENLLPPEALRYIQPKFTDPAIHWYYLPFTADPTDLERIPEYQGSFSHLIYKQGEVMSPLMENTMQILTTACSQTGQEIDEVIRVRLGLVTRTPYEIRHTPHVDHSQRHRTGIWYPISSSGDTVVYDETAPSTLYHEWFRQRPTENLWFDFPGEHWHSSATPTEHETRLVLTINYTIKNWQGWRSGRHI